MNLFKHAFRPSLALARNNIQISNTSSLVAALFPRSSLTVPASVPLRFRPPPPSSFSFSALAVAAGIGTAATISLYQPSNTVHCEPKPPVVAAPQPQSPPAPAPLPPAPPSSVNLYELGFGTVCGICAGVFVKKGAKLLAFTFGSIFVLLQYLGQQSLIRVDWSRMSQRFENLVFTKDPQGRSRAPTVGSLFSWIVDFLTADFQQRASFVAGFALGLRIG
ncbi:FUN14 family-domain-containing protein [Cristinia sonorae]|uniref:FUN14 family-domain-containing protein n=1 Tax=Cristinia sonorae TaxID=1940300 RepID=A0A8K0XUP1_9AGAR|nr:FUN14 family-domain-containing protein [Cristinia sonorae]